MGRSIPFWNSVLILLSELLPQGKDTQQTSTGKLPCLFCMAEHSCGIKGCALFEVSLLALVSGKYSSPSCTARVIMLSVSMPLACLYQLSGWCSLSCAPKEEHPKLSGFIIPEITEVLNLDDCRHKIKELEAVSLLPKVLQFQAVLQGVTLSASPLLHWAAAARAARSRYTEPSTQAAQQPQAGKETDHLSFVL